MMMAETAPLLVPATAVPVSPEIGGVLRYDNEMPNADLDHAVTAGAHVPLACLIRLDGMHDRLIEFAKEPSRAMCELASRRCHGRKGRQESTEPLSGRTSRYGTLARHG